ncbi:TPA: hypothetical protein RVS73_002063 [Pasteurella multocida]|nr:hypothetical protein [Pasteurella multocida]HEA3275831.1 hypothetical protein [Pasteurella multocida]
MINEKQNNLLKMISEPRLTYYEHYLNCKTPGEKLSAYFAYQELSGYFLPVIQLIEISMRNAIDTELVKLFGTDWYSNIPQSDISRQLVLNAKSKLPKSSNRNDMICRLTLGFWIYMLDAEYRNTKSKCFIWNPDVQNNVFPNAYNILNPKTKMSVKAIFDEMQKVLELRNRLFHHEPIWKGHNCNSHEKAILNVIKNYDFLKKVLKWISQDSYDLIDNNLQEKCLKRACNTDKLQRRITELMNHLS